MSPDGIIISPGPGRPEDAGCSNDIIRCCSEEVPILGVCLGHQCIAQEYGASVTGADRLMHGKTSEIHHDRKHLFSDLPSPFSATRYHSLIVDGKTLSAPLVKTAESSSGELMGLRHRDLPLYGIQFHPESIMTEHGLRLLENFCRTCRSFHTSSSTIHALS
jgi:anthranilate synthase/aminodeoxychorismate synthase-like glutamine amidotransferase